MTKIKYLLALIMCITVLIVCGCSSSTATSASVATTTPMDSKKLGVIDGSSYKNIFFGFTLQAPEKWFLSCGATENLKQGMQEDVLLSLLTAIKYPLDLKVNFNTSLNCTAAKMSSYKNIQNSRDYLLYKENLDLKKSNIKYNKEKNIYSTMVNKDSFDVMEIKMSVKNMTVYQKYYAEIKRGYFLCFAVTYTTQDEFKELDTAIHSIQFINQS